MSGDEHDAVRSSEKRFRRGLALATNVLLAGYLAYSAYSAATAASDVWLPVRLIDAAATGLLAALVLFRPPPSSSRWGVLAIAAVVASNGHGFLFRDEPRSAYGVELAARIAMAVAGLLGSWARLCLGRNFAILPALRDVRTRGPYAVVRHPIYVSLVLYDLATVALHPSAWNAAVAAVGVAAHLSRVAIEERFLGRDPAYVAYQRATPHRLLPFVW